MRFLPKHLNWWSYNFKDLNFSKDGVCEIDLNLVAEVTVDLSPIDLNLKCGFRNW